jgi:hypothetical protein
MDYYLRLWRANIFVEWLKLQPGAVIIGDGWNHIDRTHAQAEFRPTMNADDAYRLLFDTQFVGNTNPYGRDIVHERVAAGLLFGCRVLTDTNQWWDEHFAKVPALTRFRWDMPLADQLNSLLVPHPDDDLMAATAMTPARQYFSGEKSFAMIAAFAGLLREFAAA